MFRFFGESDSEGEESQSYSNESESYEVEPKSMADYYNDLETVIANIREEIEDADNDPAFHRAAKILTKVIDLCRDIESSINPIAVMQTNSERSKLLKTLGPDGLIEVKGEASKLLVIHYRKLMIAMANKEYWPNPPMLFAPVVHARYASELEKRASETQLRIQKYQERIDAYDKSKANGKTVESQRRRSYSPN